MHTYIRVICIYIYIYIYTHTHTHIHIHAHVSTCNMNSRISCALMRTTLPTGATARSCGSKRQATTYDMYTYIHTCDMYIYIYTYIHAHVSTYNMNSRISCALMRATLPTGATDRSCEFERDTPRMTQCNMSRTYNMNVLIYV
jgi:hypothetical protein